MDEARSRDVWMRTSALMALTANCHRDPKKSRPFKPVDFNPHELGKANKSVSTAEAFGMLKAVFVGKGKKR